jgi:hypothetical protein
MEKVFILKVMFIYPNTTAPDKGPFIISAKDIDGNFYAADGPFKSMHDDYWSEKLTREQKVPALQGMLNALSLEYGAIFKYIQSIPPEQ